MEQKSVSAYFSESLHRLCFSFSLNLEQFDSMCLEVDLALRSILDVTLYHFVLWALWVNEFDHQVEAVVDVVHWMQLSLPV